MNLLPLKTLLTAIFGRVLTIIGTWIAAKGLADPEAAHGIEVYAGPLAGLALVGADVAWEYLRTRGLHEVIAYLKEKLSSAKDSAAKLVVAALIASAALSAGGCTTTQAVVSTISENASYLQAAATAATGAYLLSISNPATRTAAANRIWSAANGVDSLANGTLPTPDALKAAILAWGGSDKDASYGSFAATVIDSYQPIYQGLVQGGNVTVQQAVSVVEAIAAGARTGAQQYATVAGAS